jgi:hypothetical protein
MQGKHFGVFVFIIITSSYCALARADICDKWFKKSKIVAGSKDCLLECTVLPVDMGTSGCHEACAEYCKKSVATGFNFKMAALYPALTTAERALVAEFPTQAVTVYQAKRSAEAACSGIYGKNRMNDESDACRHYIWAGLNTEKLGAEKAQKFLNAHEQEPTQPANEKAMDLANNRAGILAAESLIKEKKFSEEELTKRFQKALSQGDLVVLKPRVKK